MAERDRLMTDLIDLLDLPQVDKGVGSSVYNDFIGPLADKVLGADLANQLPDKYRKIQAIIEVLGGTYVPGDPARRGTGHTSEGTVSGGGGTLTNRGLRTIRDLVLTNGVPAFVASPDGPPSPAEEAFDPREVVDSRVRALRAVATRPGAARFRDRVREAYGNRCCITGADELAALDVAHISPYAGPDSDAVANALLLRADLHKLHDALLLAVSESDFTVLLKPRLLTTQYAALQGTRISLPSGASLSPLALRQQRERCGL